MQIGIGMRAPPGTDATTALGEAREYGRSLPDRSPFAGWRTPLLSISASASTKDSARRDPAHSHSRRRGHALCRRRMFRSRCPDADGARNTITDGGGTGDPLAGIASRGALMDFCLRAAAYEGDDCLIWPFGRTGVGYGEIKVGDRKTGAHRYVCELCAWRRPESGIPRCAQLRKGATWGASTVGIWNGRRRRVIVLIRNSTGLKTGEKISTMRS